MFQEMKASRTKLERASWKLKNKILLGVLAAVAVMRKITINQLN
jgi:hypothetical protein